MNFESLLNDKAIKAKAKVVQLGELLLSGELLSNQLISFAKDQKPVHKATCIEALEYATKKNPLIADITILKFVAQSLKDEEPRVKWESAKVVGNIAYLFPDELDASLKNLLANAENHGTVVRWATAYALAEILKLNTEYNSVLLPEILSLSEKETDNGVKKKYLDALKKVSKL